MTVFNKNLIEKVDDLYDASKIALNAIYTVLMVLGTLVAIRSNIYLKARMFIESEHTK